MTTVILIRQQGEAPNADGSFDATVQIGIDGAPHTLTVRDPFDERQEEELAWYYEEWPGFVFTNTVRAKQAADSTQAYGLDLFEQLFRRSPERYAEYQRVRSGPLELRIIGTPAFHALHWEALRDPHESRPLSVDHPVVRKNATPIGNEATLQAADRLRVLLVTARPAGKRDVGYRTISRPLVEALAASRIPAQIDILRPATFEALCKHLEEVRDAHNAGYYHILHLDMHGALLDYAQYQAGATSIPVSPLTMRGGYGQTTVEPYSGQRAFLLFDDTTRGDERRGNLVSADDLAALLQQRQVPIVVLNACQSGKQVGDSETSLGSRLMAAGVQLVVAMGYSVTVTAAQRLMTTLYEQLLAGKEPSVAIRRARLELHQQKQRRVAYAQQVPLEDWLLPVVYQNRSISLSGIDGARYQPPTDRYQPPQTLYPFVGRDVDILDIERRLLDKNLLLVRGMGGAGKTTLLHHLGWWWQRTNFVQQVFYFGYDAKAYHLPQIVQQIGQRLGLPMSGIADDDRGRVLRELRGQRHLLMLDNMESISGEPLAIQNTLPQAAQAELRDFLQALVGGQTLMLLGSRSDEAWLQPAPLRERDIYELPGLDYEAQSALAEAILAANDAPHYPSQAEHQADFQRLLKLLGGYPLAMQVVLANLTAATPADVIDRLQAGDVDLDDPTAGGDKTRSILQCIDYSHSNLSEAAQGLLLCLAPFTGVINVNWLDQYSEQLRAQPALAALPFEQWEPVLKDAARRGLLTPHKDEWLRQNGYWQLQPIFPYFLKTRLSESDARKAAIDEAFRAHYSGIGGDLADLILSKQPLERQAGQALIGVEYENLMTALNVALANRESVLTLYSSLSGYHDHVKDNVRGLLLGNTTLARLEQQDIESTDLQTALEYIGIVDDVATRRLLLKKYDAAAAAYKRAFDLVKAQTYLPDELSKKLQASTLHNLGIVAQEQRLWPQAERYYQQALQIYIDFNDRYEQAGTLHQLGRVAEAQQEWAAATEYIVQAAQIFIEYKDGHNTAIALRSLARLRQAAPELDVVARLATALAVAPDAAQALLDGAAGSG
ncbi:MAG: CHAT domain-containing protein [Anaerolineales bacterium]|nr:CHAT domain-containing protein [Anaerolineales bacterium]